MAASKLPSADIRAISTSLTYCKGNVSFGACDMYFRNVGRSMQPIGNMSFTAEYVDEPPATEV